MNELKTLLEEILKKKSKQELIDSCMENNHQFVKRMKWVADNPKQKKLKTIIDVLIQYDQEYLPEFLQSDWDEKTHGMLTIEKEFFAVLHKLCGLTASYALKLGYIDMSAFEEWQKNKKSSLPPSAK